MFFNDLLTFLVTCFCPSSGDLVIVKNIFQSFSIFFIRYNYPSKDGQKINVHFFDNVVVFSLFSFGTQNSQENSAKVTFCSCFNNKIRNSFLTISFVTI